MKNKDFPLVLAPHQKWSSRTNNYIKTIIEIEKQNGLVIPKVLTKETQKEYLEKLRPSLKHIRGSINNAKKRNKHVLVLPGSFDLLHQGHANYIEKCLTSYCKKARCSQKQTFVVVLADDDDLIARVKAFKHKDLGGDEPEKRPVENAAERLLSMMSLPWVDVVGIIPSHSTSEELPEPPVYDIEEMLMDLEENFEKFERKRIFASNGLIENKEDALTRIAIDKQELRLGLLSYKTLREKWGQRINLESIPVQAWQLYILGVINNIHKANGNKPSSFLATATTRLVNAQDVKYLGQVLFLMRYADIGVALMKYKIPGASTTELIKWAMAEYEKSTTTASANSNSFGPWQIIRDYKMSAIGQDRMNSYETMITRIQEKVGKFRNSGSIGQ